MCNDRRVVYERLVVSDVSRFQTSSDSESSVIAGLIVGMVVVFSTSKLLGMSNEAAAVGCILFPLFWAAVRSGKY